MYHKHFNKIDSTQKYLIDKIETLSQDHQDILISADLQTDGIGRTGSQWDNLDNALAISFTLSPSENLSFTPLEIGVLVVNFIDNNFNTKIGLKWPNDLMTLSENKCGGIITTFITKKLVIVGIGINLGKSKYDSKNYKYPIGLIDPTIILHQDDKKKISSKLYDFILKNRINLKEASTRWKNSCIHVNKKVSIEDGDIQYNGIFSDINLYGNAEITLNNNIKKLIISGSLRISRPLN